MCTQRVCGSHLSPLASLGCLHFDIFLQFCIRTIEHCTNCYLHCDAKLSKIEHCALLRRPPLTSGLSWVFAFWYFFAVLYSHYWALHQLLFALRCKIEQNWALCTVAAATSHLWPLLGVCILIYFGSSVFAPMSIVICTTMQNWAKLWCTVVEATSHLWPLLGVCTTAGSQKIH